jgi:FAD-dependent fumarate reductase
MTGRSFFLLIFISAIIAISSMLYKQLMASTNELSASPTLLSKYAIVVGSGLGGLAAASQLIASNVPVRLLERAAKPGGNSIKASSGINGAPTKYQRVLDTLFYEDTIKSAGTALKTATEERRRLISTLTNSSSSSISWLVDDKGIDLSLVTQLGGHSHPRTHRGSGQTPPGASIVTTLLNSLKKSPIFQLETSSLVTKVLQNENKVIGVEYSCNDEATRQLYGPVIFTSGGFAGDARGMLAQYRPDLAGFPSTNEPLPGSQHLLTEVGAQLLDMDLVQVHPTSFVDSKDPSKPVKFLAAELLRGEGGILLLNSQRFVNEMETRQNITDTIIRSPAADVLPRQWDIQLVLDEATYNAARSHVDFYIWKGLMRKTTVGELGPAGLLSVQNYADIASGRVVADPFGRRTFGHWALFNVTSESVIYVGRITPAVHFTMGGVMISERSEVLGDDRNPIEGLWAAGEVTGGIHGENRLGGSSLLECVVFGRIAGEQAAAAYFVEN